MNRTVIASFLTAGAVAFGLPLTAAAFGPSAAVGACDGTGPHVMKGMTGPGAFAQTRLEKFKAQLNLTDGQQAQWQAFADKVIAEAGQGRAAMINLRQDQTLTAPERMARMQALMQERLTAMASVTEAFRNLYDVLSAEQKQVADAYAKAMPHGPGMTAPGGMGRGR